MTQSTASTMPAAPGEIKTSGESRSSGPGGERSAQAARRRWLILFAVVVLVVVAVLVNLRPLTHYQDAHARLQEVTAKVNALQTQKAGLQAQLAKLSEAAYLETLAREQLTYVRPGEELYIVTKSAGGLGTTATSGATPGVDSEATSSATDGGAAQPPGLLERVISAVRGLF